MSQAYRQEIDEFALAKVAVEETTPVEWCLREELVNRVVEGKVTAEERASFYQHIFTSGLSVRRQVIQGNAVPIRLKYKAAGFHPRWALIVTAKRFDLDGKAAEVDGYPKYQPVTELSNADVYYDEKISCLDLGKHTLDMALQIDFREDEPDGKIYHGEMRHLTSCFEVVPNASRNAIALQTDPPADKLLSCISVPELVYQSGEKESGVIIGLLTFSSVPANLAFDAFASFDGKESELGHLRMLRGSMRQPSVFGCKAVRRR